MPTQTVSPLYQHLLYQLVRLGAGCAILIGILALIGWTQHIPPLYRIAEEFPPLAPLSSLAFISTGIALFLVTARRQIWLQRSAALFVLFSLLLCLLMILAHKQLIPDDFLQFAIDSPILKDLACVKEAYVTILNFLFINISILLQLPQKPRLTVLIQWLALGNIMLLSAVLFGYSHQENVFHFLWENNGIPLHSATGFALLQWGILMARIEQPSPLSILAKDSPGGMVTRWVMLMLAIFPILLGWLPILLGLTPEHHYKVETFFAAVIVMIMIITIIRLAHQLDQKEMLYRQAEASALQHQADLAHIARLHTMGEMASGIAHELNQPLAAIANYSSACQRMTQDPQLKPQALHEPLASIQGQARRASEIIRRLRAFVRKQKPKKHHVNLHNLIWDVLMMMQTNANRHGIQFIVELNRSLPVIQADAIQIEQVIMNLVQNGMDAMQDTSSPQRQIIIRDYLNAEGMIQVEISDTGLGIDEAMQLRIFEAFVTTKEKNGMGIGLSLCRSIIESHGGRLWVESTVGQGASFYFTLPIHNP